MAIGTGTVSEDGSLVYVANNNGSVAVIDAATNAVVNTLTAPGSQQRQLAGIVAAAAGWLALRQLGGMSGDVYGATEQVVEVSVLVATPVLSRGLG